MRTALVLACVLTGCGAQPDLAEMPDGGVTVVPTSCIPHCQPVPNACGDDGCGGSCGICVANPSSLCWEGLYSRTTTQSCEQGICVPHVTLTPCSAAGCKNGACVASESPCGDGTQPGAPWPASRFCSTRRSRTPFPGPVTAKLRWRVTLFDKGEAPPDDSLAVSADGTIYVNSASGLEALRPDGTLRWRLDDIFAESMAIAADGTLVLGSIIRTEPGTLTGAIRSVSREGVLQWTVPCEMRWSGPSAAIAADGTIYGTGLSLHAFAPDGTPRWDASLPHGCWCVAVAPDGTIACDQAWRDWLSEPFDGHVEDHGALSQIASDGRILRTLSDASGSVIAADGTVMAMHLTRTTSELIALPADGTATTMGDAPTRLPSIAADGTIITAFGSNQWLQARAADGSLRWAVPLKASSQPTIDGDGRVYVTSREQLPDRSNLDKLNAISPTGELLWSENIGTSGRTSQPVIGRDRALYLISGTDLYAFGP